MDGLRLETAELQQKLSAAKSDAEAASQEMARQKAETLAAKAALATVHADLAKVTQQRDNAWKVAVLVAALSCPQHGTSLPQPSWHSTARRTIMFCGQYLMLHRFILLCLRRWRRFRLRWTRGRQRGLCRCGHSMRLCREWAPAQTGTVNGGPASSAMRPSLSWPPFCERFSEAFHPWLFIDSPLHAPGHNFPLCGLIPDAHSITMVSLRFMFAASRSVSLVLR